MIKPEGSLSHAIKTPPASDYEDEEEDEKD